MRALSFAVSFMIACASVVYGQNPTPQTTEGQVEQSPAAVPAPTADQSKADRANALNSIFGSETAKKVIAQDKRIKDIIQDAKNTVKDVVAMKSPETEMVEALAILGKDPMAVEPAITFLTHLENIDSKLLDKIQAILTSNLANEQAVLVKGYGQLATLCNEKMKEYAAKASASKDADTKRNYEGLAKTCKNLESTYSEMSQRYANIPIGEHINKLKGQAEFLMDSKELIGHMREIYLPLRGAERTITELTDFTKYVAEAQQNLSKFSDVIGAGLLNPVAIDLKANPKKDAKVVKDAEKTNPAEKTSMTVKPVK